MSPQRTDGYDILYLITLKNLEIPTPRYMIMLMGWGFLRGLDSTDHLKVMLRPPAYMRALRCRFKSC